MRSRALLLVASVGLAAGVVVTANAGDSPDDTGSVGIGCGAPATDAEGEAAALYRRGLAAEAEGDQDGARRLFEAAVAAQPDHAGAREALGQVREGDRWISRAEAMQKKGLVLREGRWILREEAEILDLPAKEKARREEGQKKVRELLRAYAASDNARIRKYTVASLGTVEDAYKLEPMAYALRSKNQDVRLLAAAELGRMGNRRAIRPLLYRVIHDPSEEVRHAAMSAAASIGDPNLIAPLVHALGSQNVVTRMNAADGIGRSGDVRGVQYLVYRFEAHGGGAPRVYMMSAAQLSFIQDFDVEVAQTAFIADPIVGTIQEGTVLDAQVIATEQKYDFVEREVIYGALRTLTGVTDVPNEKGAWAAWYREHGKEFLAAAETKTTKEETTD